MSMTPEDKILVTGARGLVGSAVVENLRHCGYHHVIGMERRDCDLRDRDTTRYVFKEIRPAYVFHAAACVFGIGGNMNNQALSYLENTLINTSVIDAAHQSGVKKITAMGTNAAYPFPVATPFREDSIFDGRPHPSESGYAHAKRGMLAMLEAYEQSYGLEWAYLISCNLFGANDKFDPVNGHVVPSLVHKFYEARRTDTPVTVWGDGSARRDFMYAKDAARATVIAMNKVRGAINIASESRTIRQIVDTLSEVSGVHSVEWDDTKPNGQLHRAADLSRLRDLYFSPLYSIEQGLRETWDWYVRSKS